MDPLSENSNTSERTIVQWMDEYVSLVKGGVSRKEAEANLRVQGIDTKTLRKVRGSIGDLALLKEVVVVDDEGTGGSRVKIIGICLLAFGVIVTVTSYDAAVERGGGYYIIMFGPMLTGLSLLAAGRYRSGKQGRTTKSRLWNKGGITGDRR